MARRHPLSLLVVLDVFLAVAGALGQRVATPTISARHDGVTRVIVAQKDAR